MSTTISSPKLIAQATAVLNSGAAPAPAAANVQSTTSLGYAVGAAAGQVDGVYAQALTVTSGTPAVVDLTSLHDALGNSVTIGHVVGIQVQNNSSTSGQDITVGGGTHDLFTSALPAVSPGGHFQLSQGGAGIAISSGTNSNVQFAAAAGSNVPFTLTIFARSA